MNEFSHLDKDGNVRMVDVTDKAATVRTAKASGKITMLSETITAIKDNTLPKGNVLTTAKIADDAINSEHYTDGSIDTAHVADNQITTAKIGYAEATLTDGSTISWDASTSDVAKVTLAGNRTLAAASNGTTGQFVSLLIIQDGTGSRTLTWNAVYEFKDDTAPTLTTTANKGDLFVFRYNGSKYLEVGRNTALTLS